MKHIDDFKKTGPDTWLVEEWKQYPHRNVRVELRRIKRGRNPIFQVIHCEDDPLRSDQVLATDGVNEAIRIALHLTQTVIG